MFDISWGELVLIGMVALIVIGPKELPTVLRTVGQWMTKIRRMASEFQGQFNEAMREAEFADLKKEVDALGDQARGLTDFDPLKDARAEFENAFDDKALTPSETNNSPSTSPSTPGATHGEPPPDVSTYTSNFPAPDESARAALDGATPAPEPAPETAHEPASRESATPAATSGGRAA